jgi:uncharacterized protein (DUF2147 family)
MRRALFICLAIMSSNLLAQEVSPVGLWRTIDDRTGKPKALVRISESGGELTGKIEKLFREPGADPDPKCGKCEGHRKDKPIVGLIILSGLKRNGEEYQNGQILDPENGKLYASRLNVSDDGKQLQVRGYIGVPLLGRTQVWMREE